MGLSTKILNKKNTKLENRKKDIESARQKELEMKDYVTLCTRMFFMREGAFSLNDSNLSELDKMVFPFVTAGAVFGSVPCGPDCPGYTPIPVKEFPFPGGGYVKCKRLYPKEMYPNDTKEEWQELREFTIKKLKKQGKLI